MKKIFLTIFSIIFTFSLLFKPVKAQEYVNFIPSDYEALSQAVYLYSISNDQIIYTKNADMKLQPASLTKIMTTIIVLEAFNGDEEQLANTVISSGWGAFNEFAGKNVSTADFKAGEEVSYLNLLYGLLLQSACEAANILALNLGDGDIDVFVEKMNNKAKEIGCNNTNFTNAHGLEDDNQYTTAEDMAKILEYAYKTYPLFSKITSTQLYTLPSSNKHPEPRKIFTTNYMLKTTSKFYCEGITSGKTGTLEYRNLATTANRNGNEFLLVTLASPFANEQGEPYMTSMVDQLALYDWAYSSLSYKTILSSTEEMEDVYVKYGKDATRVLLRSDKDIKMYWPDDINLRSIERIVETQDDVMAPVSKDTQLGTMTLKIMGQPITQINLYTTKDIELDKIAYKIDVAKQFTSSKYFVFALLSALGVTAIFLLIYILRLKNKPLSHTVKGIEVASSRKK